MNIVFDTNVVLSGAWKDGKPEEAMLKVIKDGRYQWIVSEEIIKEYIQVLNRKKFRLPHEILEDWHQIFLEEIKLIEVKHKIKFLKDPKDACILECAVEGDAEYIVTGDKKHLLPLKEYRGIKIVQPKEFLELEI